MARRRALRDTFALLVRALCHALRATSAYRARHPVIRRRARPKRTRTGPRLTASHAQQATTALAGLSRSRALRGRSRPAGVLPRARYALRERGRRRQATQRATIYAKRARTAKIPAANRYRCAWSAQPAHTLRRRVLRSARRALPAPMASPARPRHARSSAMSTRLSLMMIRNVSIRHMTRASRAARGKSPTWRDGLAFRARPVAPRAKCSTKAAANA